MDKYHKHKRFDEYCDYCGEPTRLYDELDEWKKFERDTLTLKICRRCRYEQFKNSRKYLDMKELFDEKFGKTDDKEENRDSHIHESLDKGNSSCYNIFRKIKKMIFK